MFAELGLSKRKKEPKSKQIPTKHLLIWMAGFAASMSLVSFITDFLFRFIKGLF